ncbi:hypothetical protein STEG23_026280, partial [Scotinomys teguina]
MASAADGDVGEALEQMRGLWPGVEDLSLNKLASSLGASEQALRLIISIFLVIDVPGRGSATCGPICGSREFDSGHEYCSSVGNSPH